MGEEIQKENFARADYDRFQQRLEQETELVRSLFAREAFDNESRMLGYELELCLADANGQPSKNNIDIIEATGNPLFTSELAKFNMEINGNPFPYAGDVFNRVEADLNDLFAQALRAADSFDTHIGMFGVFPSVTLEHRGAHPPQGNPAVPAQSWHQRTAVLAGHAAIPLHVLRHRIQLAETEIEAAAIVTVNAATSSSVTSTVSVPST